MSTHYLKGMGSEDLEGAHPLVRISISAIPSEDGPALLVLGLETGHPLDAGVVNARQVFAQLHKLLPDIERRLRADWVEHRKVCLGCEVE